MTRYNLFNEINKLCELTQTGEHQYNKMVHTGLLEFCDYNTGLLDICMYYLYQDNNHIVRIWFGTIDDGDFGSWTICDSKEEALELLNKVVDKFKDITVLPTINQLNKEFEKLKIYFCYE